MGDHGGIDDQLVVAVQELTQEELLVCGRAISNDVGAANGQVTAAHRAPPPLDLRYSMTVARACCQVSVDLGALTAVLKGHSPSSQ